VAVFTHYQGSECCLLPVAAAGAVTEVVTLEVEWDWYSGSSVLVIVLLGTPYAVKEI
jgi:hypothetical protein